MSDSNDFSNVIVVKDWGRLSYYTKVTRTRFGTVDPIEQDPSTKIKVGDYLLVKWQDGTIEQFIVSGRAISEIVADMGHNYPVETTRLFIVVNHHGKDLSIPLDGLLVRK